MVENSEQNDRAQADNVDTKRELQLQYTVASCASLDCRDHDLMLFYFEPAVGSGLPGLTLQCPSSKNRIQSDSGTLDSELPCDSSEQGSSTAQGVQLDDIDHAFIDLVGDEYIFPLQV